MNQSNQLSCVVESAGQRQDLSLACRSSAAPYPEELSLYIFFFVRVGSTCTMDTAAPAIAAAPGPNTFPGEVGGSVAHAYNYDAAPLGRDGRLTA